MPPKKRQRVRQSARTTRQSARLLGKTEDDVPAVYGEILAEVAEEEKTAGSKTVSKRKPTQIAQRSTRHHERPEDGIPAVYGDMLAEALAEEQAASSSARPSKRRKTSEEPSGRIELDFDLFDGPVDDGGHPPTKMEVDEAPRLQQVTLTEFDSATESDVDFEDVDLEPTAEEPDYDDEPEQKLLELDLSNATTPKRTVPKRKPVSAAERKLRLDVHKAHIVMLLAHLKCRNQWCDSESVQSILKPLIPRKITSLLHVDDGKTQYERNQSFTRGIEEVCAIWKDQWTMDGRGMLRAHWRDDVDAVKESDDTEDLEFNDFRAAAIAKQGSRDLAAQLFCALLRSIALEARLVCSLQALPFSRVSKGQTPEKSKQEYFYAPPQNYNSTAATPGRKKTAFAQSLYPIFWVEVYSAVIQTWIPLDPIVRHTINKPKTGFEPHANDNCNKMSYVVAFEDDGSAKDVTRRYTQFYNSKIRKQRVECTPGGEKWWDKTMSVLQKPFQEPRDDIEDAFLQKRTEGEPMPNNIQDFKGHSVYVLDRHLRLNEVIHPRREVGKVSIGIAKNAKLVSVFRRRDVHVCRTADAWYRRGRDVDEGEQPLKRAIPKRKRTPVTDNLGDDDEDAAEGTALYAEFQTSIYEPPPVVNGKVPRNAYGNLDVYVPSMIPPGAVHIRHPLASKAARILGVDYADAVTGFQFKGRQGTAVVDGVVVSMTATHAMSTVIEGVESQASEDAQETRSRVILAIWKKWLAALRIREHVQRQYGDKTDEAKGRGVEADDSDEDDATFRPEDDGGGFMLEEAEPNQSDEEVAHGAAPLKMPDLRPLELPPEVVHQEIIVVRSPHKVPLSPAQGVLGQQGAGEEFKASIGGDYVLEDDHTASEVLAKSTLEAADEEGGGFFLEDEDEGGGFLPEDADGGGGFLPEEEDAPPQARAWTPDDGTFEEQAGGFLPAADPDTVDQLVIENAAANTAPTVARVNDRGDAHDNHEARPTQSLLVPNLESKNSPGYATTSRATSLETPRFQKIDTPPDQGEAESKESPASALTPGSLLSHDPEEDDAEPEWLLNSLGEID